MCSIIDIGVNYYGWSAKDIVNHFKDDQVFSFDNSSASSIRDLLIEMPGVYCSYGLGCSSFITLCEDTKAAMGDRFDYVSYHDALMKNGPLPFNILQTAVDEYIAAH